MKPSQEFTIKILSPEDYDKLPYPKAKESLGMSVMETKTAYIRKTGVEGIDQHTIEHEFDELMQQTSPHEIDGIRYKIPILGPIFSVLAKVISGAGAAIKAGGAISGLGIPAKIGVGLGKAALAAPGLAAGALASKGVSNVLSTGNPFKSGSQNVPGFPGQAFSPTQSTSAFAPQTQQPLGQAAFNTSLSSLDKNAAAQRQGVFDKFRGLGTTKQNTAFASNVASAKSSSDLARSDFLEDQRKLGSTFV